MNRQRTSFTLDKENESPTLNDHNNVEHDTNGSHEDEDNELNDCESGGLVTGRNEGMMPLILINIYCFILLFGS